MQVSKQKLDKLLAEMAHFDPDNMQMGAKTVTDLILSNQLNLEADPALAKTIRQAFLKQMQHQNNEVNAHAIKCVADIVPKLPIDQVGIIFQRILTSVCQLNISIRKRQRYGIAASTIIHKAADLNGLKLCGLFVTSVNRLLQLKDMKSQIQIILITIIYQFIKKWPAVAANPPNLTYDKLVLAMYLLKNVQHKTQLQMVEKSQLCLGKLALIIDRNTLSILFDDQTNGILKFIKGSLKNPTHKTQHLIHLRNGLICLSQILSSHNFQLKYWARPTTQLVLPIINNYKNTDQLENIALICDILDACLVCLSYCLKSYPNELKDLLDAPINPLNNFVMELINFNLQHMMSQATIEQPMQVQYLGQSQDLYYQTQQADQKCWKVRRATINYISFLVKHDKYFRNQISHGSHFITILGSKLVQENSLVCEMAFSTFNSLVESISARRNIVEDDIEQLTLERVKSTDKDLALSIISEVNHRLTIVFSNAKFTDDIKVKASKLMLRLILFYRQQLVQQKSFKLIIELEHNLRVQVVKKNNVESRNNLLLCLKQVIFEQIGYPTYKNTTEVFLDQVNCPSGKLQTTGFQGLKKLVKTFRNSFPNQAITKVVNALLKKLKQQGIDRTVKVAALKCTGIIFQHFFPSLTLLNLRQLFQMLSSRLQIDVDKNLVLQQLSRINFGNNSSAQQLTTLYQKLLQQTAQSLDSVSFELNSQAIAATAKLIALLGDKLSSKAAQEVLSRSKALFLQCKIPSYITTLLQKYPKIFTPYVELIIKSTQREYILALLHHHIIDITNCISVLKTISKPQKTRQISSILGRIGVSSQRLLADVNNSSWGKICLGALGYVGNANTINFLLNIINEQKNQDMKDEAASALGNIISRQQDTLIPHIILCANQSHQPLIFFIVIRQMLNFSNNYNIYKDMTMLTQWLFGKAENKYQRESSYYVIAQCIGKIALTGQNAIKKVLENVGAQNENLRFVLSNSLRFGLQNRPNIQGQFLSNYIHAIMTLLGDQKVSVRQGATRSLNAITNHYFHIIKQNHNETFWQCLTKNMLIDPTLQIIIDYGISKQKKDLGKALRLQTFTFLQLIARKMTIDNCIMQHIIASCLDKITQQTSTDIILKRLNLIKIACESDYLLFIPFQADFIVKMNLKTGLWKNQRGLHQNKIEDQHALVYLKNVLKEIVEINAIAIRENVQQINTLLSEYRANNTLKRLLEEIDKAAK